MRLFALFLFLFEGNTNLLRAADGNGVLSVNMSRIASILGIGRTTLYRAVDALAARSRYPANAASAFFAVNAIIFRFKKY